MAATIHMILDALRRREPLLQPLEASAALRTEVPTPYCSHGTCTYQAMPAHAALETLSVCSVPAVVLIA